MPRLPGDPSIWGWLLFSIGFRLPPKNREWVRHELIDAGWRGRTIRRLLVLMVPICIALAFLPGPVWLRIAVPLFALVASVGTALRRRWAPDEPVVIKNLKYWGVPRNDGFVMMPNEVEAYRVGKKAFEFKHTNGFMITLDINSKDIAAAQETNGM